MIKREDPANVVVLGSDNPEADARRAVENDFRIRQGLCPNGDGLMTLTDYGQRCSVCGFICNTKPDAEQPH